MSKQKTYNCFDWDDNLVYMPTNIILFHKDTHKELTFSTEDFAHFRNDIGTDKKIFIKNGKLSKTGTECNLQNYKIIGDDKHPVLNSFREFRDCENKYFMKHIKEAISKKAFGPEWDSFVESTLDKKNASEVYIITARGQSPQTIYEGIKYLKEIGLIQNHIPRKNIFPVSHSKFKGKASSPQALKLKILKEICSKANDEGKRERVKHTVYFSDDDLKTMSFIKEKLTSLRDIELSGGVNYWKNINIRLRYTGTKQWDSKLLNL